MASPLGSFYGWKFSKNLDQYLSYVIQLSHGHVPGTAMEPHVHWHANNNGTGNVVMELTVSFAGLNQVFSTPVTQTITVPAPGNHPVHSYADFQRIEMPHGRLSDLILVTLGRLGSDAADTYDDGIFMLSGDFHQQVDQIGSRKEYEK